MPPKPASKHKVKFTKPVRVFEGARIKCQYYKKEQSKKNIARHRNACKLNPNRDVDRYKCGEKKFGKGFDSWDKRKDHEDRWHSEDKKYGCEICHKRFWTRTKLARHKRYHKTERPYVYWCTAAFKMIDDLHQHAGIHDSSMWIVCPFDLRVVRHVKYFPQHLTVHSHRDKVAHELLKFDYTNDCLPKPEEVTAGVLSEVGTVFSTVTTSYPTRFAKRKRYIKGALKCEKCTRAYSKSDSLSSHERAQHTEVDKYTCPLCLFNPTIIYNFKRHLLVHVGGNFETWQETCQQFDSKDLPKHKAITASVIKEFGVFSSEDSAPIIHTIRSHSH